MQSPAQTIVRIFLAAGVLLLAAVSFLRAQEGVSLPEREGRVQVQETTHDFGRVLQNRSMDWDFVVCNVGSGPLRLLGAEAQCACTVPELEKKVLNPGECVPIHVTFHSERFEGPVLKPVTLRTDDPQAPSVLLELKAQVETDLHAEPFMVNLVDADLSEGGRGVLVLAPKHPESFRILEAVPSSPSSFRVEWAALPDGKVRLVVTYLPAPGRPASYEPLTSSLRLRTTSETWPEMVLPVNVSFRPDLIPEPARVDIRCKAGESSCEAMVRITERRGRAFRIQSAQCGASCIRPEVRPWKTGEATVFLRISRNPGSGPSVCSGMLSLETDRGRLDLPVRALFE